MGYNDIIGRTDVAESMVPDQIVNEILQEAPKASVVLSRARRANMTSKKAKQPVLSALPKAYWVNGDTGLKQTTKDEWDQIYMTAEELAVIVPIPNALVDDSNVPLWNEIRPLLAEAIGRKVDDAALFGVDRPASWPQAIIPSAIAAGNTVYKGTGSDLGVDVAMLNQKIAEQGFGVNGFATKPGMQWELVGLRNDSGTPIYTQSLSSTPEQGLYGYPLNECTNGSWISADAELLSADWTKFVVGIRQDITFDLFSEGVISDADGKIVLNLMQQDTKALRVVFRVGFQCAKPLTRVAGFAGYPAGVIQPSTYTVNATVPSASTVVFDKTCGDIQDNITIDNRTIRGDLKYIADWTSQGFDMSKGHHFVCIHFMTETAGASLVAEAVPSQGSPSASFTDDEAVIQVNEKTTAIKITETVSGVPFAKEYPLFVNLRKA